MGDWLGTGRIANYNKKYRPFIQARSFARSLKLRTGDEWAAFCRGELTDKGVLPTDIPARPIGTYRDKGWIGYGDWLGTGTIAFWKRQYKPFEEARSFARSLNLKSRSQWTAFCQGKLPNLGKLPKDIPTNPENTYRDKGWDGVGDWLGTGVLTPRFRTYRPFKKARSFVQSLGLKNSGEWLLYCAGKLPKKGYLPKDIPSNPNYKYKNDGWSGMGDWLGTGEVAPSRRTFWEFKKARSFVRKLRLRNQSEWRDYCTDGIPSKPKIPLHIPTNPQRTYANSGWKGMKDWLGTLS